MKTYGGSGNVAARILNLDTRWGERSSSLPGHFNPGVHWIEGRVGPRAGLDVVAKIKNTCLCRELNPDRSSRSLATVLTEVLRLFAYYM
jgi:hypothetical protein